MNLGSGWFAKKSLKKPWDNSYWRRVATRYVGDELSPGTAPLSAEGQDRLIASVKPEEATLISTYRNQVEELEKTLALASTSATGPDVNAASATVRAARLNLLKVEAGLAAVATEREWLSLYHALSLLPAPALTFSELRLLMDSLQATGVGLLLVMVLHRELWNWAGVILSILLIVSTGYTIRLSHAMNGYFRDYGSSQLATMIRSMRKEDRKSGRWPTGSIPPARD